MTGAVSQLRELFPFHSSAQLQAALDECNGSTDRAAEALLQQIPAGSQHGVAGQDHTVSASRSRGRGTASSRSADSSPSRTSWAGLKDPQSPNVISGSGPAPHSPLYIRPRGRFTPRPPPLTKSAFPALTDGHLPDNCLPTANPEPAGKGDAHKTAGSSGGSSTAARWKGSAGLKHRQADGIFSSQQQKRQQQQQPTPRRSLSAQSFADTAKQHPPPHCTQLDSRYLLPPPSASTAAAHQMHPAKLVGHKEASMGQQQQLDRLTQQLSGLHPWCSTSLLQEVLQSVDGDAAAATAALLELVPTPASPPNSLQQQQQQHDQQPQNQQQHQQPAEGHPLHSDEGRDLYHVMRREAIRLTNKWQKVLKRSAAAAAAGDHSAAKQLSAEARALKAAVDEAHAAAAVKIEVANNSSNSAGLWELDLHGLHAKEALLALQGRLELLQSLVQDILGQAQAAAVSFAESPAACRSSAPAEDPAASSRLNVTTGKSASGALHAAPPASAAGGGRQQLLAQLLLADDERSVPLHVRQSAARQELRVIVGKGNNSSGGEASLPRVVEQWLSEHRFRFVIRTGAIDVKLRRLGQSEG